MEDMAWVLVIVLVVLIGIMYQISTVVRELRSIHSELEAIRIHIRQE